MVYIILPSSHSDGRNWWGRTWSSLSCDGNDQAYSSESFWQQDVSFWARTILTNLRLAFEGNFFSSIWPILYSFLEWSYQISALQDFYLDLTEDNRKITPRDYLELALRPVQGGAKDVAAKNEVSSGQKFEYISEIYLISGDSFFPAIS